MTATDSAPQLTSVWARAMGIILSPGEVFKEVVASPRPVGILFVTCLIMGLATAAPQFTERGARAALDMQVRQTEQFMGTELSPEMRTGMEQRAPYNKYFAIGGIFVAVPFFVVLFTALYWFFFNVVLGGTATFKQALGVFSHSQVIAALGAVAAAPVQIVQDVWQATGPYNFGVLVPMLDPQSAVVGFLSYITPFTIWQTVVTGIGFAILYRRRTTSVVIGMLIFTLALSAAFAALPLLFRRG